MMENLGPEGFGSAELKAVISGKGVLIENIQSIPAGANRNVRIAVDEGKQLVIERMYAAITTDPTAQITISIYTDPDVTIGNFLEVKNRSYGLPAPAGIGASTGNTLSGLAELYFERSAAPTVQTSFAYAVNSGTDLVIVINNGDTEAADVEVVAIGLLLDI